jgi:hypothetical protein
MLRPKVWKVLNEKSRDHSNALPQLYFFLAVSGRLH